MTSEVQIRMSALPTEIYSNRQKLFLT